MIALDGIIFLPSLSIKYMFDYYFFAKNIMKKIRRQILQCRATIIVLCTLVSCCAVAQNQAELDTIAKLCITTYCTPQGIVNCNRLIRKASQFGNMKYVNKGYSLKMSAYVSMGLYDRAIVMSDSIEKHTNVKSEAPLQFDYILTQKASAYLMNGQTELCIATMQPIYKSIKEIINSKDTSEEELSEGLKLYVTSLKIMAVASFIGKQNEQATDFFEQAIAICREHPTELHINFMDITFCRFSNMSQVAEQAGTEEFMYFINRFEQEIKDYVEYATGHRAPEAIKRDVLFYTFVVKCSRLDIAIKQQNVDESERLVRSLDSLYAVSPLVRMRDKDFYASKSDYYLMIGNYEKALAFNDSVIKRYVAMGSYENEYHYIKKRLQIHKNAGTLTNIYAEIERLEELADTIIKQNTTDSVQELSAQMNIDQMNDVLKAEQEAKNMWMTIGIVAIALVVILGIALVCLYHRRNSIM